MKLSLLLLFAFGTMLFSGCKKNNIPGSGEYEADVANAWMQLQIRLTKSTPGYNSVVSLRSFGYSGVTLYESILPSTTGCRSLLSEIGGPNITPPKEPGQYFWPASANAAMATITRMFFESTSAANRYSIDSLETFFNTKFQAEANAQKIQNGIAFGHEIGNAIFEWSKTDGGHEAYKHVVDSTYVPPSAPGLWISTPPAFGPPVHPHWGSNRSFISNSAERTLPEPPLPYSESNKSAFYAMVNELYIKSLSLSHEDSITTKFWGEIPGNINVPAHATNIVTQLIKRNKLDLRDAAAVYAMHGVALNDAGISVFKAKYTFNLVRPVSYIRGVMQKPEWNTVIPTPSHPEYPAAHAVVSSASATVLEGFFGKNYSFSDHTYSNSYGTRYFNSFEDYAKEAGWSRVLAGIHYAPSVEAGSAQGKQIGKMVNKLKLQLLGGY